PCHGSGAERPDRSAQTPGRQAVRQVRKAIEAFATSFCPLPKGRSSVPGPTDFRSVSQTPSAHLVNIAPVTGAADPTGNSPLLLEVYPKHTQAIAEIGARRVGGPIAVIIAGVKAEMPIQHVFHANAEVRIGIVACKARIRAFDIGRVSLDYHVAPELVIRAGA